MAADDAGEKTEEATPQRREEFRKKGQVAQTKELATFFILFAASVSIWALGKFFLTQVSDLFVAIFADHIVLVAKDASYGDVVSFALKKAVLILGPLFLIASILALSSSLIQVGILYNEEALKPDLNKINPINGFKRLFSMRSVVEGLKAVAKVSVVALIVGLIIQTEILTLPRMVEFSIQEIFSFFSSISIKLVGSVAIFMAILAALDYAFQKYDMEKQMRMTKQEIKEEQKNREGDPLVKARVKRVQRELANQRMMQDVPKADVIITNPTHIAVAIKYETGSIAPILLAKGADKIAEKIKEVAKENNIPVVENKPLARAIYKTLKIGQLIPRELFKAVAEVLAYVYRLRRKIRKT